MDFAFDEDQELLRSTTQRFLEQRHPLDALRPVLEADEVVDPGVWREGAALGWTAMLVPEDFGGGSVTAQPLVDLIVLAESLGAVLYPGPFLPTNVVADAVARCGSDQQRKEVLPALAVGEVTAAWCFSSDGTPDTGSVEVRAQLDGDRVRIDGVARYVHGASAAGLLLVAAMTEGGLTHLLVPLPTVGINIRLQHGLDLTRRLAEVAFEGVDLPASALLGSPGVEAEALAARAFDLATIIQAAEIVGAADHLLSATLHYAQDRVQFGRPIGSFQAIKHRLADLHISAEAMRAATHYAALAVQDDLPDAAEAVATAGSYVPDAQVHLCGEALQLHGGIGFTWEHDVHLFVRRAKVDQVLYGDPHWHRDRLCRLIEAATPEAG